MSVPGSISCFAADSAARWINSGFNTCPSNILIACCATTGVSPTQIKTRQALLHPLDTEAPGSFWVITYWILHDWVPHVPLMIASVLLLVLLPIFEKKTSYFMKTIAVGSGQAMAMGQKGEADVLLVHSPAAEKTFMAEGYGINRKLVMHNDFVIVGPKADLAGIAHAQTKAEVFFKGKKMNLIIPYSPGGGYDLYARMVIPSLEKYTGAR
jgi:hypothetical protein